MTDLKSKNGTEVEGKRVQEQILFPGNTLSLAATYHFRVASPNQYVKKSKSKPMLIAASVLAGICLIAGIGYWLLS